MLPRFRTVTLESSVQPYAGYDAALDDEIPPTLPEAQPWCAPDEDDDEPPTVRAR
jgi:hypothetical protein